VTTPGARLRKAREQSGYRTAKEAAIAMAVPLTTYNGHENADRFIPARRAAQYARHFGTTPEYLMYGRAEVVRETVAILDTCGAHTGDNVVFPSPSTLTFAQAPTVGDGLAFYGFVALYDQPQSPDVTPDLYGKLCVVSVRAERNQEERLIRVLHRGSTPDRFHLVSAGSGLPLVDQTIVWAAPVTALVPAG
jgi:hypothetical protein